MGTACSSVSQGSISALSLFCPAGPLLSHRYKAGVGTLVPWIVGVRRDDVCKAQPHSLAHHEPSKRKLSCDRKGFAQTDRQVGAGPV